MQVFRGIPERADRPAVVTIGNFDGVHLGHQSLIRLLKQEAEGMGLPATLVTFEPHPREFFTPDEAPARLASLREKLELLAAEGVERVHVCRFNHFFASLDAEEFIHRVLVQGLATRHLLIGDDFCFGRRRRGNFAMLQAAGPDANFTVQAMDTLDVDGERVSSSAVRQALAEGELVHAARLLGRPYSIAGRVLHGDKIGRTIGFPTANIQLRHRHLPLGGIFTVAVEGLAPTPLPGVASIGVRPTVTNTGRPTLEVHLLDWQGDCYGALLRVHFLDKQRDEAKYPTLDALTAQIQCDADQARAWFVAHPLPRTPL